MRSRVRIVSAVAAGLLAAAASADQVVVEAARDNTLFSTDGATSNGAGDAVFCGRTGPGGGGTRQRAVLAFDVAAAVPAGATITSATLTLDLVSAGSDGPETITVHRLLADWGEGTSAAGGGQGAPSTPGDATWLHTFYPDLFWTTPGGDFDPAARASLDVTGTPGPWTWGSTPGLVADVQAWLDEPAADHGWLLLGNEASFNTARRFASREATDPAVRPSLALEFTPAPASCPADVDGSGTVDVHDLLAVISAFGPCPPGEECPADLNGNGFVGVLDLLLVLLSWGPCP
ncbi:MAG: DNRLRE domain-containing protein [Planctomycetota bacterium]|jgi:hypothetical protein